MPRFIDYHAKMPDLPQEAAQQMADRIKAGNADEHGVTPVNVYLGGGQAYCVSDAPSADAVRKAHQAAGGPPPDQVVEVQSLA